MPRDLIVLRGFVALTPEGYPFAPLRETARRAWQDVRRTGARLTVRSLDEALAQGYGVARVELRLLRVLSSPCPGEDRA